MLSRADTDPVITAQGRAYRHEAGSEFVARELGFVDENGEPLLTQNSMDAVADRDAFLDFAQACAVTGVHLSRMAEDLILWNSLVPEDVQAPLEEGVEVAAVGEVDSYEGKLQVKASSGHSVMVIR